MLLVILEVLFVAAIGVGCWVAFGLGPALIVGGGLGVLACEWSGRRPVVKPGGRP